MAIHASKFSSKSKPAQSPVKFPGRRKWSRIVIVIVVAAVLIVVVRLSWELVVGIPSLPGEASYPYATNWSERVNVLVATLQDQEITAVAVASIGSDRIELINLDPSWNINVPQYGGGYRIGAIKKLGDLTGGNGINLLQDSISRLLAMPIDGYIVATPVGTAWTTQHLGQDQVGMIQTLSSQSWQLGLSGGPPGIYSSFNRLQLLQIGSAINRTAPIEVPRLSRYFISNGFDSDAFDNDIGARVAPQQIARHRPRVSIVNASGVAGAGTEVARYVHNLGGEVTMISSSDQLQTKTVVTDHVKTPLANRISSVVRVGVQQKPGQSRVDLEITLGQDIALFF